MGKRWRKYTVGRYRLGALFNKTVGRHEAVVCWRDDDRKPHRHRLGVFSETEGRSALDAYIGRIETLTARATKTVGEIWKAYVADREKDGKLVATFAHNWKALAPRFAAMQVVDINNDVCRDYAQARMTAGRTVMCKGLPKRFDIGVGTVWTELTRLRSALNWAEKQGIIERVPPIWVPRKPDPKDRVLTPDEFLALLDACTVPHLRLFVILAITTGARSEAILQLGWAQVDFAGWVIDFREKPQINPLTKRARKARAKAPMTEEARSELLRAYEGRLTDNVIEWDGAPVKKIRKAFQAAVDRAGLKGVTPHTLRHTVATWLDEGGIPMERISKLLGHRHIDTTRLIYSKPSVDTLRPAGELIDATIRRNGVQNTGSVARN